MSSPRRARGRPPSSGREEILRATHELLRERGVARLTTREVAERAKVSEGSIFYHFTDRPGLLKAVFARSLGPLQLDPPEPLDLPEPREAADLGRTLSALSVRIEAFLTESLDVLMAGQADSELRDALHAYMLENDYGPHRGIEQLADYLAARQRVGQVRSDVLPRVIAAMVINDAFQRASLPKLVGHRKGIPSRREFIESLVTMLTPVSPDGPPPR